MCLDNGRGGRGLRVQQPPPPIIPGELGIFCQPTPCQNLPSEFLTTLPGDQIAEGEQLPSHTTSPCSHKLLLPPPPITQLHLPTPLA